MKRSEKIEQSKLIARAQNQGSKVENETKTFLQYENIEPNNYCIIQVDDYDEILHKTRRSSPGPDKISYNILKK